MGGHHVPLVGDDPHHHHSHLELRGHDHRDRPWVDTQPPVVLPVDLLVMFFFGKYLE